jgi:outer membrane protein assembly factor BamD (BamD/ComL family)
MASKVAALVFLASLSRAPFQCAHDPSPDQRTEDDPAEALYLLAEQFNVKGDQKARTDTLEYLAQRYPTSRYAVRAREDMGKAIDPPSKP